MKAKRSLDFNKLQFSKRIVSSKDALKNVDAFSVSNEVVSGKATVTVKASRTGRSKKFV